jgi:hypothetical protein
MQVPSDYYRFTRLCRIKIQFFCARQTASRRRVFPYILERHREILTLTQQQQQHRTTLVRIILLCYPPWI